MPVDEDGNYFVKVYGPYFEKMITNRYYNRFKDDAIIEPNIRFIRAITPSVVDLDAEFDLLVSTKENSVYVIECKARAVTEFDINKFSILLEDIGLLASNIKIYSTRQFNNVITLLNEKNISSEFVDLVKLNRRNLNNLNISLEQNDLARNSDQVDNLVRSYVKNKATHMEMDIYFKYSEMALFEHPGYYILLNNCWKQPFSVKQDIFHAIKEAMKISITKADGEKRKILEFIYIKTFLLEKWHNPNINRKNLPVTRDLIKIIMGTNYNEKDKAWRLHNEILENIKTEITNELGTNLILSKGEKGFKMKKYKSKRFSELKYRNITILYIIVGMDRFILKDLSIAIYEMHKDKLKKKFNTIDLIHTTDEGSIDATHTLKGMLSSLFTGINIDIDIIDYRNNKNQNFDPYDFVKFINDKAHFKAALIVTYIPKEWVLYLHTSRRNWGYFLVIDRPEYSDPFIPLKIYNFPD